MTRLIWVLLVDDQDLVRMGLRTLFEQRGRDQVGGEAADGLAAVELASDAARRGADGHPDARHRRHRGDPADRRRPGLAQTRVIVLTTFELDEYVFDALRHGASGFLLKNTPPAELLAAVRTVAAGDALLSPSVTRSLIRSSSGRPAARATPHPHLDDLTDREREIVDWSARA